MVTYLKQVNGEHFMPQWTFGKSPRRLYAFNETLLLEVEATPQGKRHHPQALLRQASAGQ